jgi:hypothetical protein
MEEEVKKAKEEIKVFDEQKTFDKFSCNNNFLGVLGEMVFTRWLKENHLPFIHVKFVKKSWDDEDFVIDYKKVDIKTTFDTKMWFQKAIHDIYILSRVNDDLKTLFVLTYITKHRLEKLLSEGKIEIIEREGRKDYVVYISQMHPIEQYIRETYPNNEINFGEAI